MVLAAHACHRPCELDQVEHFGGSTSPGVSILLPGRQWRWLAFAASGGIQAALGVIDHGRPCVMTGGRCARRLVSPADGYQKAFRPALRRALLAWRCASVLLADPHASMEAIMPRVRCHAG